MPLRVQIAMIFSDLYDEKVEANTVKNKVIMLMPTLIGLVEKYEELIVKK